MLSHSRQHGLPPAARAVCWAVVAICGGEAALAQAPSPTATAATTPAAQYEFVVKAGANYSDNVLRVSQSEESATAALAGFELSARKPTGRLTFDAIGDLAYLEYFGLDVPGEVVGSLDARGRYQLIEGRFAWTASNSYQQLREDFRAALSPVNRQGYNTFNTGPELRFRFGAQTELVGEALYARNDYGSTTQLDSTSVTGRLAVERRLGPRSSAALFASSEQFEVDDIANVDRDFERREYGLRFVGNTLRTNLFVEAGLTEASGNVAVNSDGPLVRLTVQRRIAPAVTLNLSGSRQIATTGDQPRQFRVGGLPTVDDDLVLPAAEPFDQTIYGAGLTFSWPRTLITANVNYGREDYEAFSDLDRRTRSYGVFARRRLTPRTDVELSFGRNEDEFVGQTYDVSQTNYGVGMRWRLTRALAVALDIAQEERASVSLDDDYSELVGQVTVRYSPWTPSSGAAQP